jgi:hypothetical protein
MDNATGLILSPAWEPWGQSHPPLGIDRFFVKRNPQVLRVGRVTLRRPLLPRARRSC